MNARGLLVENHNGLDFLLTTEFRAGMKTHRLVVLQRINGKWERVNGTEGSALRESLIGALVDFIVDICRVLNSSSPDQVSVATSTPGRFRARHGSHIKARRIS